MNAIERMQAALDHRPVDHPPFVPSIYEHGARVIDKAPAETARSADLMARAALRSYDLYRHDLVTVGIDIYNIEAEAFGCRVSAGEENAIPGILSHPLADQVELNPDVLTIPQPGPSNRMQLIVEAAAQVRAAIGHEVWVNACMGGPFSQAVELRGFENLVMDMREAPERVHALLEKTTELSLQQAARLSETGCGVNIFESWATIPLIDPATFGTYVVPYNKRVMTMIRETYDTPPPSLIMGGNTAKLMDYFIEARTSLVVADFNTDFDFMRAKTAARQMLVRGCVDPKLIERADWPRIEEQAARLAGKARGMRNFVWGCGAVSYNTGTEDLLRFKEVCARQALDRTGPCPGDPGRSEPEEQRYTAALGRVEQPRCRKVRS